MSFPAKRPLGATLRILPQIGAIPVLVYGIWPFDWHGDRFDLFVAALIAVAVLPFAWRDVSALHYNFTTYAQETRLAAARAQRRARRQAADAYLRRERL